MNDVQKREMWLFRRPLRGTRGRLPTQRAFWLLMIAMVAPSMIDCFGNSSDPIAEPEFVTSWGESGSAPGELHQPIGIAVALDATVFVADTGNDRIQLLAVFGSQGSGPGEFERPTDLDIGADGRIYVVDFGNDRIQVFEPLSRAVQ